MVLNDKPKECIMKKKKKLKDLIEDRAKMKSGLNLNFYREMFTK